MDSGEKPDVVVGVVKGFGVPFPNGEGDLDPEIGDISTSPSSCPCPFIPSICLSASPSSSAPARTEPPFKELVEL